MAEAAISDIHLTQQGRRVLEKILHFQEVHGYSPTIRELCDGMGLASVSTVHCHLLNLRDQGAVTWVYNQVRTLVVTGAGRNALQ